MFGPGASCVLSYLNLILRLYLGSNSPMTSPSSNWALGRVYEVLHERYQTDCCTIYNFLKSSGTQPSGSHCVMPSGLKHVSPAFFQRRMGTPLQAQLEFCRCYVDNLTIFRVSKSFDEHLVHLRANFEQLRRIGFCLYHPNGRHEDEASRVRCQVLGPFAWFPTALHRSRQRLGHRHDAPGTT